MTSELTQTLMLAHQGLQLLRAARGGDLGTGHETASNTVAGRMGLGLTRAQATNAGRAGSTRFAKTKIHKASSAEAIVQHCLRQRGWSKAWTEGRISDLRKRRLLGDVRQYGRAWMRHEAESFLGRYSDVSRSIDPAIVPALRRWFNRNIGFVQELIVAAAMSQEGGKLSADTEQFVAELTQVQREYLDQFYRDISHRSPTEIKDILGPEVPGFAPYSKAQVVARAEQYGNAAWQGGQKVLRRRKKMSGGARWEWRILGHPKTEHCDDCPPLAALGWQPIGTLPDIGDTECGGRCYCHFEYSDSVETPTVKAPEPRKPKKRTPKIVIEAPGIAHPAGPLTPEQLSEILSKTKISAKVVLK